MKFGYFLGNREEVKILPFVQNYVFNIKWILIQY